MIKLLIIWTVLLLLLFFTTQSTAQKVYKCTDAQGVTTYSQTPCSADPAKQSEITIKTTVPPTRTAAEIENVEALQRNTKIADANYRENACVQRGIDGVRRVSSSRIGGYEQQITGLQAEMRRARNNLAGATYQTGIRDQISSLNQLIATERTNADAAIARTRTECAERRKQELED